MDTYEDNVDLMVREVGPREGFQIEPRLVPAEEKVRLISALAECHLPEIQVTSFVSPKWVPQMADAERVVELLAPVEGVRYVATALNRKGVERAAATGKVAIDAIVSCSASESFSLRNVNRTTAQVLSGLPERIELYKTLGLRDSVLSVNAAFGCNWSGQVELGRVLSLITQLWEVATACGLGVKEISLADTMGWADPAKVREMVAAVQREWAGIAIGLHLHDTRGMGLANAYAAIEGGVHRLDAAVGGLGGCPFAGRPGASGNIATEDLVHMCDRLGVRTGVDCDGLVEVGRLAEEIVGHTLPGKVMRGGLLSHLLGDAEGQREAMGA